MLGALGIDAVLERDGDVERAGLGVIAARDGTRAAFRTLPRRLGERLGVA